MKNATPLRLIFQEKKLQQVFLVQTFDYERESGEESVGIGGRKKERERVNTCMPQ